MLRRFRFLVNDLVGLLFLLPFRVLSRFSLLSSAPILQDADNRIFTWLFCLFFSLVFARFLTCAAHDYLKIVINPFDLDTDRPKNDEFPNTAFIAVKSMRF